ncbi:hypothetical protein BT69DRAFT_1332113 [Atractiella rhizophila]|nr:hypothetical protein BT69DRAFT_1332113 [Atractiella rhizophila]
MVDSKTLGLTEWKTRSLFYGIRITRSQITSTGLILLILRDRYIKPASPIALPLTSVKHLELSDRYPLPSTILDYPLHRQLKRLSIKLAAFFDAEISSTLLAALDLAHLVSLTFLTLDGGEKFQTSLFIVRFPRLYLLVLWDWPVRRAMKGGSDKSMEWLTWKGKRKSRGEDRHPLQLDFRFRLEGLLSGRLRSLFYGIRITRSRITSTGLILLILRDRYIKPASPIALPLTSVKHLELSDRYPLPSTILDSAAYPLHRQLKHLSIKLAAFFDAEISSTLLAALD